MINNKKSPRCPYCGSTMNENLLSYSNGGGWCNFECPNCGATSPKKENSESCNKAELAAYFVAKKRYEEPNRVLTLEEVREIAIGNGSSTDGDVCWLEQKKWHGGEWASINSRIVYEYFSNEETFDWLVIGSEDFDAISASEYGKTWRCWLRHPTKPEMTETPWEGESDDDD